MKDPYAFIDKSDPLMQERLSDILELRAADPQQKAMLQKYLSDIKPNLSSKSKGLEIGCGTGAVSKTIVNSLGIKVIGIDPSPVFIARAQQISKNFNGLSFMQGDGKNLEFSDNSYDIIIFHTSLCHIPEPQKALCEAYRVLRPGGLLSVFDGDYASSTVAISKFDPLQQAVDAMFENFVHNKWLTRRLPKMLQTIGFNLKSVKSYGYAQTTNPDYMLTVIDRGIDIIATEGGISSDCAAALKNEARQRIKAGKFFGHITFFSILATKPK